MKHIKGCKGLRLLSLPSFVFLLLVGFTSCEKYLEAKPDEKLRIPNELNDLQIILDNYNVLNNRNPQANFIGSDDYYITFTDWNALSNNVVKDGYIWYENTSFDNDWRQSYEAIYYANIVLENIERIAISSAEDDWENRIKGSALFFRAYHFFNVAQLFCKPFIESTASSDLGIPLRINSNFNEPTQRASVQQTYNRIISDLKEAANLLPTTITIKTRPSKASAYAELARVYLSMSQYQLALKYADTCLQLYNVLLDYNNTTQVIPTANIPFQRFNSEVIFSSTTSSNQATSQSISKIDSVLYGLYHPNDIRRQAFFRNNNNGTHAFKGSYDGSLTIMFTGLTTSEIYLIKAEAEARMGDHLTAITTLNTLLTKRWKPGTFTPYTATDVNDALVKILIERRKELVFRGIRWSDLRRLNLVPSTAITLKRIVGQTYTLAPNDLRYVILIPTSVIQQTLIQQNPR